MFLNAHWSLIFILLTLLIPVYGLAVCVYNIFFHPLRNYPGPFLRRATRVTSIYWDLQGMTHLKVKELHDKYGHVVRIAPNELSYNTAQAWTDICGHRSRNKTGSFEKDPTFFRILKKSAKLKSIVDANEEDHRRMRRLQSHAFSEKALSEQEDIMEAYVKVLIEKLHTTARDPITGVVDLVKWYNFTTFDIIGDLAFGSSFGCLRDGVWHRWIDGIFKNVKAGLYVRAAGRFPFFLRPLLLMMIPRHLTLGRAYQAEFAASRVNERLATDTDRHDFMSYILRKSDKDGMTIPEMQIAAQVFILGGSETTATLLSGATYLLLAHRKVLERLVREIRTSFNSEQEINMLSTARLTYLNAVLEEALRMYPPVPNALPRQTPYPGEVVCGQFVPGGTSVGIPHWATYHSASNFRDPEKFDPERWLGSKEYSGDAKEAFQPFSTGPRNCIGKHLAYSEMKLILSRIIWNFDLELYDKGAKWMDQRTFILWEKPSLLVKLIPVKK